MKLFTVVPLIACFTRIYAGGLNIGALLGGAGTPANGTAPVPVAGAPVAAPTTMAPIASAAPTVTPPASPTQASPVSSVPNAATTSKAPCPYANTPGTPPPAAPAQPVVGPKAREMENQMTNLRTAIELFQDFQRQYQLADDNPIMQQIYQLFAPILQAANNIR